MGTWNVTINGNDTAQDLKSEYQAAFFYNDVETALAKIDAYVRKEGFDEADAEEWCDYCYSLADYMWKHGILTDAVRDRVVGMIDSGFGLELWEEAGTKTLEKRQKVLAQFREKLQSPQPPKKKITIKLYLNPIFETGDLVAIQLQTADKYYLERFGFSEQFFRECHGKYVVLRKVTDHISYTSAVEPAVSDHWAIFQLYGKVFDTVPAMEELAGIPWADPAKEKRRHFWVSQDLPVNGIFCCESSMFYFRKRKYVLIGQNRTDLPQVSQDYNATPHIFLRFIFGSFKPFAIDTENASIAKPTPSSTLLKINNKFHSIFCNLQKFLKIKKPDTAKAIPGIISKKG